jgi:multimeric flavodoxin WrbA
MKILAIASSQRRNANSETLLDRALSGIDKKGVGIKKLILTDLKILPCTSCQACFKTGKCVINDDMQIVYEDLLAADILLIASPIYFQGPPCRFKCLIDRCQALWARKYILRKRLVRKNKKRKGAAIFVCASSGAKNTFVGAVITMKAWFRTLDIEYSKEFLAEGLEGELAALKDKQLLKSAVRFGATMLRQSK